MVRLRHSGIERNNSDKVDRVNDDIMINILRKTPLLEILDLSGNRDAEFRGNDSCPTFDVLVSDATIHYAAQRCPRLFAVDLRGAPRVSNAGIDKLAILLQESLEIVCLGSGSDDTGVYKVNDSAIKSLSDHCDMLRHLDLSCCRNYELETVVTIAENLPYLEHLDIVSVEMGTDGSYPRWGGCDLRCVPRSPPNRLPPSMDRQFSRYFVGAAGAIAALENRRPNLKFSFGNEFKLTDCYHTHDCINDASPDSETT